MDGLALAASEIPTELIERCALERFAHERGGEREIRFLRRSIRPLLPVWHDGQLRIVDWGSRTGRLPRNGLTWQATIESGRWSAYGAKLIDVRASCGLDGGVWFRIRQGVRGLLVETSFETAAYLIVEPADYYYRVMTRRERMPVLIEERI